MSDAGSNRLPMLAEGVGDIAFRDAGSAPEIHERAASAIGRRWALS
jgi:hypothetical protein